jgi:hypothetical protein
MPLILSGSVNISGSMTATTIVVSAPGAAGMVSSSAQITELAPLMAYTASIKAASIVSSSQQIQNYFTFARTGSVNTFFGNQGISGSLNVTSATGTNVTPQLTVNNTTTNGYGILRLVGAGRGGLIDFYNTSSAQASIAANDGALQIYTNGDSTGTPTQTITATGRVGINQSTPNYSLDIYSGSSATIGLKTDSLYNSMIRDYTASATSLDISTERTDGGGFNFLLIVSSILVASAGFRNYHTFAVHGRGTDATATQLSNYGVGPGNSVRTAISVSFPSNGVMRLTVNSGEVCQIKVTMIGHGSL